ncbi:exosome catalytic subunit dis3 [Pleurotus pulmonarius]|nr:exosome catalytic subunit dis3 [Pleurotus pulmonarius]
MIAFPGRFALTRRQPQFVPTPWQSFLVVFGLYQQDWYHCARHLQDELTTGIHLLNSLAIKLKAERLAAGASNLAEKKELRETNNLVEEFMLLANVSVAQKIQETFPQTAVLQQQMPPPKENSEKLQDILMKRRGLSLDVSRSGALAVSLDLCLLARLLLRYSVSQLEAPDHPSVLSAPAKPPSRTSSFFSRTPWFHPLARMTTHARVTQIALDALALQTTD